MAVIASH